MFYRAPATLSTVRLAMVFDPALRTLHSVFIGHPGGGMMLRIEETPAKVRQATVRLVLRACAIWLIIIAAESVNGALRQLFIAPAIGDALARQTGFFSATLLTWLVAALTAGWLGATGNRQQLQVGALWTVLTLAFEWGIGLFVMGYSFERMLSDYDPTRGGMMLFAIPVLLLAPRIGAAVRRRWRR